MFSVTSVHQEHFQTLGLGFRGKNASFWCFSPAACIPFIVEQPDHQKNSFWESKCILNTIYRVKIVPEPQLMAGCIFFGLKTLFL